MAGVSPEYTLCVESVNRQQDGPDPQNPTNDVTILTQMSRNRIPVTQLSLCSAELPLPQYTVESTGNKVYFSEGLALVANTLQEQPVRQFQLQVNSTTTTATLPAYLNAVIAVDASDPTNPVFTTEFEHGLELSNQWTWGAPVQLISTNLGQWVSLSTNNPDMVILNTTQFMLMNQPAVAYVPTNGLFGYVHAPPIATPQDLARIVQAGLNLATDQVRVTYQTDTGCFCIQYVAPGTGSCVDPPPTAQDFVQIVIPTAASLPVLMGFACGAGSVPLPTQPAVDCQRDDVLLPRQPQDCKSTVLCGQFGSACSGCATIPPGNYTFEGFAAQLALQLNRFYFDPGSAADPLLRPVFAFSNSVGTFFSFAVEYGLYTPFTLAQFLEDQMNTADATTNAYSVTYDTTLAKFVFANPDQTFGLEFGDPTQTLAPILLGFDAVNYRGNSQYQSVFDVNSPILTCCEGTSIPARSSAYVYGVRADTSQNRYILNVGKPVCVDGASTDLGGGILEVVSTGAAPVAHGLQVEDVVVLTITGTGTFRLRVVEVVDALTFRADIGSVTALVGLAAQASVSCLANPVVSNLLLSSTKHPNVLPGRFLGLPQQDLLFSPGVTPPFQSQFNVDLSAPKHLLLVLDTPQGATHTNHRWLQDNIPNVFAKIILYPQFRLERIYPMTMYVPQVEDLTSLKFRFLNPDHTPYQFHGQNWSVTICMYVPEARGDLMCK